MSSGQILPSHMLVHFVISHCPIAFSQVLLLPLSCQPPPCSAISPLLLCITSPATASHSLQHSPVMWTHCCLSLHVNLQVCTVCGCPCGHCSVANLWHLSWGALGMGGVLYEWGILVEQWALILCGTIGLNILHLFVLFCDWDPSKNGGT